MSPADTTAVIFGASDLIAIGGAVLSMIGALVAGIIAASSAKRLATVRRSEERRNFCLHLQQQFDSPEMFRCRYKAWQKLDSGDFKDPIKLSELFSGDHWTPEVSTTIHFFESLNRYCAEELIDEELAAKLFGRTYEMWWQGLLGRIEVDEAGEPYRAWLESVRALHDRMVPSSERAKSPIGMAKKPTA